MNDGLKYIDIVWAVLNSWYVKFAEISPRLIVGILVFIFFLKTSKYLSKVTVKLVHNFFPDSNKQKYSSCFSRCVPFSYYPYGDVYFAGNNEFQRFFMEIRRKFRSCRSYRRGCTERSCIQYLFRNVGGNR